MDLSTHDPPISDAAVSIRGLTKRFGTRVAVDEVDLDIPRGQVLGFLGPNGAGKSTTLRILAGLLRPSEGRAMVLGLDCWTERDHLHPRIGYLPGDFVADRHLRAAEYLRFVANLRRGVRWETVIDLADRFDLDLGRRFGALSHGNRQKVGLIQAFMHDPDVLLLDEPTSGLDPLMQRSFLQLVGEVTRRGTTIVLSSHVMSEVEEVADRIALIHEGRLVLVESIADLAASALHRLDLTFTGDPPVDALRALPNVTSVDVEHQTVHVVATGSLAEIFVVAAPHGIERVESDDADLEEIFLSAFDGLATA